MWHGPWPCGLKAVSFIFVIIFYFQSKTKNMFRYRLFIEN